MSKMLFLQDFTFCISFCQTGSSSGSMQSQTCCPKCSDSTESVASTSGEPVYQVKTCFGHSKYRKSLSDIHSNLISQIIIENNAVEHVYLLLPF